MGALWDELSRYMERQGGITPAELARRCGGMKASQFAAKRPIRSDSTRVDPDTLRKLHEGTGIPLVRLIVASGMWTADELDVEVVEGDPRVLSNDELLAMVRRRMQASGPDDLSGYEPIPTRQSTEERDTGRSRPHLVAEPEGRVKPDHPQPAE